MRTLWRSARRRCRALAEHRAPRGRPALGTLLAVGAVLLTGCAPGSTPAPGTATGGTTSSPSAGTGSPSDPTRPPAPDPAAAARLTEYRPGKAATAVVPDGAPAVVVLVPGGGWSTADPAGLAGLAGHLEDRGLAVLTITYGTDSTGEHYPVPADDVACAVAQAAALLPDRPVVLVGHSAGAHLAALVGLVPQRQDTPCPHEPAAADGVVGLAGPYDVTATGGLARRLFGVAQAQEPGTWAEGNPVARAAERPEVPFLLVHGDADDVVPVRFTEDLATALRDAGHEVAVQVLAGVDHAEVYRADVVGDLVSGWVQDVVVPDEGRAGS